MGLELAQILARDTKRKPRIFRWLHGTLETGDRSTESIRVELDALQPPKRLEPVYHVAQPATSQPATSQPAGIPDWWKALKAGKTDEAMAMLQARAADEKPAAESLAKDPPQPAERITLGGVAAPSERPANGAEGDRTLNLRIANATAERPSGIDAAIPSEDRKTSGQATTERRIANAALSPVFPDPLNYTSESLRDQNHLISPECEP